MIVHPDDVVMFYMGLLGQLHSNCDFIAVCHRAIVTPQTEVAGRRVHVSFIDFGDWFYDKEKWGSAQTSFPAGENYLMNKKKEVYKIFFTRRSEGSLITKLRLYKAGHFDRLFLTKKLWVVG